MGAHVVAGIGVFDQRCTATMILVVGKTGQHHAAGQGIGRVRADHATAACDEVINGSVQHGPGGITVNVEDKNLAGIESTRPEVMPVIGEPRMMSFVASAHGQ